MSRRASQKPAYTIRAAERRRCEGLRPSLHWKGLLFIARASRLYRPLPRARRRGHGELLKLLRHGVCKTLRNSYLRNLRNTICETWQYTNCETQIVKIAKVAKIE